MNFVSRDFQFLPDQAPVIIAEAGVNHNGSRETALRMVDAACKAGVDIVKFQVFCTEKEISRFATKAPYQKKTTGDGGNQLEMAKALELSPETLRAVKEYCGSLHMPFLCAAFDFDSVDLLVDEFKLQTIKIPSGEITNIPFLEYIGSKGTAAILSTGASQLNEVAAAIQALRRAGCPEILLFHCVSSYPTPPDQLNLRAMLTLRKEFALPVGLSDHTQGITAAIAASALGAAAIEKHFTLDRNMPGPDHQASVEPAELHALTLGVREAHRMLGTGIKAPAPCEQANLPLIRKSLVAARTLKKGTRLTRAMVEIKRPEGGIAPADLSKVLGRILSRDLEDDCPIQWEDLG
jgi:N-acetylneuraminate synthase